MEIREFLLQSFQANQEVQTELFENLERVKQNVEYFQPLMELILDTNESLGRAAESLWWKQFARFYKQFEESGQIAEIKQNLLQIFHTETVPLITREKLVSDVISIMDKEVNEWPELFEFVAQSHSESIELLKLSTHILIEAEKWLQAEELAPYGAVYIAVLTACAEIDDEDINTRASHLLSKVYLFTEDDLAPFFEKYFVYFQQLFAENPESVNCFHIAESISQCFNNEKIFFDVERIFTELAGMIQPDHSPWIPIYVLSRLMKYFGQQASESFGDLVQASLACAIYVVENNSEDIDELESHVDLILKLPYKCMRASKGHDFLEFLIPSLPTDSDAGLYVSLQLIRDIIGYSSDCLPAFLPSIVQLVQSSFESETPLVLKAAYTCAGDIAIYANSFYNLNEMFTTLVGILTDIVGNIESVSEDAIELADILIQNLVQFVNNGNNLSQEAVASYIQACVELATRQVHLVTVLYSLSFAIEDFSGLNEIAEQLLQIATEALESDECKSIAIELIGTLVAKAPEVIPISTVEVISEVLTSPQPSLDLLASAFVALIKVVLAKPEGIEEFIVQMIVATASLLGTENVLGSASAGADFCRMNALCFLTSALDTKIEIDEQVGELLLCIAEIYSRNDDTYKFAMPLLFTVEVYQNFDFDDDLQSALEQCQGTRERVSSSLYAVRKLIKMADDIEPEQIAAIFEVCINALSRNLPCMKNDRTEDSVLLMDECTENAVKCIINVAKFYRALFPIADYIGFIQEHSKVCSPYETMLIISPLVTFCQEPVEGELLSAIFQIAHEVSQSYDCTTPPISISLMRACALQDAASFSEHALGIIVPLLKNETGCGENVFYQQAAVASSALILSLSGCSEVPLELLSMAIEGLSCEGTKENIEICLVAICNLAENSSELVAQLQGVLLPKLQELNVTETKFQKHYISEELKAAIQQLIETLSS